MPTKAEALLAPSHSDGGGGSGSGELGSARLTLRGALKRAEERFGETPAHKRLAALVPRIAAAEDAALAAKRAAAE